MDVQIALFIKFFVDLQFVSRRANVADTSLCRLLHHITQLSCKHQLAGARHRYRFNEKCIASNCRPGQTCRHAHFRFPFDDIEVELLFPQQLLHFLSGHADLFRVAANIALSYFSAKISDFTFQVPHA